MEDPKLVILNDPFNDLETETTEKLRKVLLKEKVKNKIVIVFRMKDDITFLVDEAYEIDARNIQKYLSNIRYFFVKCDIIVKRGAL